MRYLVFILVSVILLSCTQKQGSDLNKQPPTDTTLSYQEAQANTIQIEEDSSLFISHIMTFPETSEFYVPLYYLESQRENNPYEYLSAKLDSLIYKNGEGMIRKRLPLNIAEEYFMLSGLSRISVYNKAGDLITDATFERVEHFEDIIEGGFIAVFKPMIPSWYTEDVAYCLSAMPDNYKLINPAIKEIKDANLATQLLKRFENDSSKVSRTRHFQFFQYNSIYSIVELDHSSYLFETAGNESTKLYETQYDYLVMEILPVHIEMNGKPVLLITEGLNESDMIDTYLAVYTSKGYELMSGSRINAK